MERFQANKQFSVHNLWNIKSINKEEYVKKSLEFNRKLEEQQLQGNETEMNGEDANQMSRPDDDYEMALPNDDDDQKMF